MRCEAIDTIYRARHAIGLRVRRTCMCAELPSGRAIYAQASAAQCRASSHAPTQAYPPRRIENPAKTRSGLPRQLVHALLALTSCLALALAMASLAAASTSVDPANYAVGALCATPAAGHAGCFGLRLAAREPLSMPSVRALPGASGSTAARVGAGAASSGAAVGGGGGQSRPATETTEPINGSRTPGNLLSAYGLGGISPASTQTIALVDAYDDVGAEADLEVFSKRFGLPSCTTANGCFQKVNQAGNTTPLPASSGGPERGWAQEIATDVEVAHGVCESCHILLVEAQSNSNLDLFTAEQTAAALGATEISNSWGGEEGSSDSSAFNHPGIVITASSGDNGYLNWFSGAPASAANYPASSPHVVAVGGTRLLLTPEKAWREESVWNDGGVNKGTLEGAGAGGGGCSTHFAAPSWQLHAADWAAVGCGSGRAVADVSADADPFTGVAIYDSTENPEKESGWGMIGGTSVASPIIAATYALAGGAQGVAYPARTLYENESSAPATLHDVLVGSNGKCDKQFDFGTASSGCSSGEEASASCAATLICLSSAGYDGPSGVGTPAGIAAFVPAAGSRAEAPAPSAPAPAAPAPGSSVPGRSPAVSTPVVSALALTRSAIVALNRHRPKLSKVGFAFTLSLATRVRIAIAKRVRVHGRVQWRAVSAPATIAARAGTQTRRLSARGALAPGRYELTLTPAGGSPRSLVFLIG
jgi:hypothetical protein